MKMKKFMKRWMPLLLTLMVCVGTFWSSVVPVYASMEDESMDYTLGETYHNDGCYRFSLSKKSHVTFSMTMYGSVSYDYIELYNASGRHVFYGNNMTWSYNNVKDTSRGQVSRTLNAGTYYLKMRTYRDHDFRITAEPLITLARGSITSLKRNKSGQLTVSCKSVPYAIGYRIQYSTDYRFRKGVKTIYSPVRIKTLTKLSKGKRYYVRVTPYTVYTDGEHAWGATSYVKSAVVKK